MSTAMPDWRQGSFEQLKACATKNISPHGQCEGNLSGIQPYLKQSASSKACLFSWKPYFVIGMAVSHADTPLSLACYTALCWPFVSDALTDSASSSAFSVIALLPSSPVLEALILGNPWHCCWLGWPEVLLPVNIIHVPGLCHLPSQLILWGSRWQRHASPLPEGLPVFCFFFHANLTKWQQYRKESHSSLWEASYYSTWHGKLNLFWEIPWLFCMDTRG